jgi:hypothetical protein
VQDTPFGADWATLDLPHLGSFFAELRDEGQRWEGKGTDVTTRAVRRSVCGFANTTLGGYLVLGVDQRQGQWGLNGWEARGEATQWVTDCIRDQLDPPPTIDVRSWTLDSGRAVAVVRVGPIAAPPCITSDGYIYERVGPTTAQVSDAAALHRLIQRGETARQHAWQESREARDVLFESTTDGRSHPPLVVSLATPALPADVTHLFWRQSVVDGLRADLQQDRFLLPQTPVEAVTDQGSLTMWSLNGVNNPSEGYTVLLRRTGAVSVAYSNPNLADALHSFDGPHVRRCWEIAAGVLHSVGAEGPAHIAVRLLAGYPRRYDIDRWAEIDVSADAYGSMLREVARIGGTFLPEPEA